MKKVTTALGEYEIEKEIDRGKYVINIPKQELTKEKIDELHHVAAKLLYNQYLREGKI